jgi:hypothetical protein
MPGLVVTTGVRVGATGTTAAPASSLFIVGTAQRGPIEQYTLVESMTQAEAVYGEWESTVTLYDHLRTFFEEGGTRAYVVRVTGPAATGGNGLATTITKGGLDFDQVGPGQWSEKLTIQFLDGLFTNTRRVKVVYDGELLYLSGDLASNVAIKDALDANVGNYIATTINSATLPSVDVSPEAFDNTGAHDNGNVIIGHVNDNVDQLVDALSYFVPDLGTGAVVVPDTADADLISSLPIVWERTRDHALENSRIAYCAFAEGEQIGDESSGAVADLEAGDSTLVSFYGEDDATKTNASALAFFWPWVTVPTQTGGSRTVSPETFAAAARCRAHVETGPWRPSAGVISASRFVTGLEFAVNSVASDTANRARINPLRVIEGGVRVYGARSISADETNWRYITFRDTLNFIVVGAERRLEPYIFNTIDSRNAIFSDIAAALVNLLEPIRAAGGLYESNNDRGYVVEVSDALNPQAQLAQGVIAAKVGVRVSSVGETINLLITKSNLTTAV